MTAAQSKCEFSVKMMTAARTKCLAPYQTIFYFCYFDSAISFIVSVFFGLNGDRCPKNGDRCPKMMTAAQSKCVSFFQNVTQTNELTKKKEKKKKVEWSLTEQFTVIVTLFLTSL